MFETKNKKSVIQGFGYDKRGNKLFEISGSWLDKITVKNIRACSTDIIWQEDEQKVPLNSSQQYDFNHEFSLGLNELTEEMKNVLPPTDSRFRPDQRLLEQGDLEKAQQEKLRLEQKQREFLKANTPMPLHFFT